MSDKTRRKLPRTPDSQSATTQRTPDRNPTTRPPLCQLWDVDRLAQFLVVSHKWVYERNRPGHPEFIPHLKMGKYVRYDPNSPEFRAWLKAHEISAGERNDRFAAQIKNGPEGQADPGYTEGRLSGRASRNGKEKE